MSESSQPSIKHALGLSFLSAFIAGLCCFSPVVIVLLGLGSTAFAGSLATDLYENYKWYFRAVGLIFLLGGYYVWYRQKAAACSISQQARLRKKMLNIFLLSLFAATAMYLLWTYVIVKFIGAGLQIWEW